MDQKVPADLRRIWKQDCVAVVLRKGDGFGLTVKLPHDSDDLASVVGGQRLLQSVRPNGRMPERVRRFKGWLLPKSWFNELVNFLLDRFGAVYIIQPYRAQEKCDLRCMNAQKHECQCSCMGAHHGEGGPGAGWFVVSDTFATRWGEAELACRLLQRTDLRPSRE